MTIIILLDAGIAVNPEPVHTLKNPTEVAYGIFNITLVYFSALLICNLHTIELTHLKCASLVFSIFTEL